MDDKHKERLLYLRKNTEYFYSIKHKILDTYGFITDRDIGDVAQQVPVTQEVDELFDAVYEEAYKKGMEDAIYAMAKR